MKLLENTKQKSIDTKVMFISAIFGYHFVIIDQLMSQYCGSDQLAIHKHILTISDEVFLLLVLINYAA